MSKVRVEKIATTSAESAKKHTGRTWDQWIALLDKAGGRSMGYRELNARLSVRHKLKPYWAMLIAMGYEIHIGRRVLGRNSKGEYGTVASKTIPLTKADAWEFLTSPEGMKIWLKPFAHFPFEKGRGFEVDGGVFGEVRTVKKGERVRFTWTGEEWPKPSVVQVMVIARKGEKSLVVIQHEKIPSMEMRNQLKEQWKESLGRLAKAAI
jgi:uncharacterized protein YndB with AHSA1/START domain